MLSSFYVPIHRLYESGHRCYLADRGNNNPPCERGWASGLVRGRSNITWLDLGELSHGGFAVGLKFMFLQFVASRKTVTTIQNNYCVMCYYFYFSMNCNFSVIFTVKERNKHNYTVKCEMWHVFDWFVFMYSLIINCFVCKVWFKYFTLYYFSFTYLFSS